MQYIYFMEEDVFLGELQTGPSWSRSAVSSRSSSRKARTSFRARAPRKSDWIFMASGRDISLPFAI